MPRTCWSVIPLLWVMRIISTPLPIRGKRCRTTPLKTRLSRLVVAMNRVKKWLPPGDGCEASSTDESLLLMTLLRESVELAREARHDGASPLRSSATTSGWKDQLPLAHCVGRTRLQSFGVKTRRW